jgi:hypothetical protein
MKLARTLSAIGASAAFTVAVALCSCSGEPYERTDNGMTVRLNGKSDYPRTGRRFR